jgi:hypothetical protein
MKLLDPIYLQLLGHGLLILRNAAYAKDIEWCEREADHLHNIPSLIGDDNVHRHTYYVHQEARSYAKWVDNANRPDLLGWVQLLYMPLWTKMIAILEDTAPAPR